VYIHSGIISLRPAIFSLKQVKSKLLTAPNTGKENPLCNFAFGIDDVLVIQFTATHFHTCRKLDDYKRILMILSLNDVAGLRCLLGAAH